MGGNMGGNHGDYRININNTNEQRPSLNEDTEEEEDAAARARETDSRMEFEEAWRKHYGRAPSGALAERVEKFYAGRFDPGMIEEAVYLTAFRSPDNPAQYLITLLSDWRWHGVRTQDELGRYLFLIDAKNGRHESIMSPSEAEKELRAMKDKHIRSMAESGIEDHED